MTKEQLQRLEMNLTKSASKAKQGYVRCMVGHTQDAQGFAPIDALPVYNFIQDKETKLAEFIEDTFTLNESYLKLKEEFDFLKEDYLNHVDKQLETENEFKNKIIDLKHNYNEQISLLKVVIDNLEERLSIFEDSEEVL